jgi:hypothetical protein
MHVSYRDTFCMARVTVFCMHSILYLFARYDIYFRWFFTVGNSDLLLHGRYHRGAEDGSGSSGEDIMEGSADNGTTAVLLPFPTSNSLTVPPSSSVEVQSSSTTTPVASTTVEQSAPSIPVIQPSTPTTSLPPTPAASVPSIAGPNVSSISPSSMQPSVPPTRPTHTPLPPATTQPPTSSEPTDASDKPSEKPSDTTKPTVATRPTDPSVETGGNRSSAAASQFSFSHSLVLLLLTSLAALVYH